MAEFLSLFMNAFAFTMGLATSVATTVLLILSLRKLCWHLGETPSQPPASPPADADKAEDGVLIAVVSIAVCATMAGYVSAVLVAYDPHCYSDCRTLTTAVGEAVLGVASVDCGVGVAVSAVLLTVKTCCVVLDRLFPLGRGCTGGPASKDNDTGPESTADEVD